MSENYLNLELSKKSFPFMRDVFIDSVYEAAKKDKDIFCLDEISDKLTGLFPTELIAISTNDITANLPLDVNFII